MGDTKLRILRQNNVLFDSYIGNYLHLKKEYFKASSEKWFNVLLKQTDVQNLTYACFL